MDSGTTKPDGKSLPREMVMSLVDIFHMLSEWGTLPQFLDCLFDAILRLKDYQAVWLFLADSGPGSLRLHAQKGLTQAMAEAESTACNGDCVMEFVLSTGQPIAVKDVESCQRLQKAWGGNLQPEVASHISIPVRLDGRTIGILNVGTCQKRNFVLHEIQFLAILAGVIALLLKKDGGKATPSDAGDMHEMALRRLMGRMMDGILVMDKDFHVTLLNPPDRPFLSRFSEFEKGEFYDRLSECQGRIIQELTRDGKEMVEVELSLSPPGGRVLRATASPVRRGDGSSESVVLVVKDVTHEKAVARKEQMETKVSSIGTVLEGLSHELNNPLAAVSGYLQMMKKQYAEDKHLQDLAGKMEAQLNRTISMLHDLIAKGTRRAGRKFPADLADLLAKSIEEVLEVLGESGISFELSAPEGLPLILMDADKMGTVFRTVLTNAAQKIQRTGHAGQLELAVQAKDDTVQIIISDISTGPLAVHLEASLTPLMETVKDDELDMAFCYTVVQDHGGVLYAQLDTGRRSGYIIELPMAETDRQKPHL